MLEQIADDIRSTHGVQVSTIDIDLSDAQSPRKIYEIVSKMDIQVDYLVNNAGF